MQIHFFSVWYRLWNLGWIHAAASPWARPSAGQAQPGPRWTGNSSQSFMSSSPPSCSLELPGTELACQADVLTLNHPNSRLCGCLSTHNQSSQFQLSLMKTPHLILLELLHFDNCRRQCHHMWCAVTCPSLDGPSYPNLVMSQNLSRGGPG